MRGLTRAVASAKHIDNKKHAEAAHPKAQKAAGPNRRQRRAHDATQTKYQKEVIKVGADVMVHALIKFPDRKPVLKYQQDSDGVTVLLCGQPLEGAVPEDAPPLGEGEERLAILHRVTRPNMEHAMRAMLKFVRE